MTEAQGIRWWKNGAVTVNLRFFDIAPDFERLESEYLRETVIETMGLVDSHGWPVGTDFGLLPDEVPTENIFIDLEVGSIQGVPTVAVTSRMKWEGTVRFGTTLTILFSTCIWMVRLEVAELEPIGEREAAGGAGVERSPERPVASISQVYGLADAIEDRYRLMVLLGTFCGFRLGELLALRRERIDVLHRRVIVSEQMQELADGTRHYGPLKTAAGVRTVALPPHLVADVEDHLLHWTGPAPTDLLFGGPKATELYRATFNSAWDRARRAVGMDDFHFHDLRHTGNTLAAGTGTSTKELMARMGHASARAALIFQHASEERDALIAERLSAMTEEALGKSGGDTRQRTRGSAGSRHDS